MNEYHNKYVKTLRLKVGEDGVFRIEVTILRLEFFFAHHTATCKVVSKRVDYLGSTKKYADQYWLEKEPGVWTPFIKNWHYRSGNHIIPEGIKSVPEGAFEEKVIKNIKFPLTLKIIDENAFWHAEGNGLGFSTIRTSRRISAFPETGPGCSQK